jgi:peptidoglycan/xylan/chitin deacetylase (PgdA/CDA1 family)
MAPAVKSSFASTLYHAGLLSKLINSRLRNRAVVLTYHRVIPSSEIADCPSNPGIVVSSRAFEAQMRFLRRHFRPLSLDRFVSMVVERKPFEPRSCLVTFDDGWRDNSTHARPILEKYEIPAVVYLATGYIGTDRRFWQESMTESLLSIRRQRKKIGEDLELAVLRPCLVPADDVARAAISRLVASFKGVASEEIDRFQNKLAELAGGAGETPAEERHFMDWDEVAAMKSAGVEIGCHGVNHLFLTDARTDVAFEVEKSKKILEEKFGASPSSFCYPNGDYDSSAVEVVRRAGFSVAFSTDRGYVSRADDPYLLKRNNICEEATRTVPMFLARIAGLW